MADSRSRARRIGKTAGLVLLCGAVAGVAALGVDHYRVIRQRQESLAQRPAPDRSLLQAPVVERWRAKLFAQGAPAPRFDLADVSTGRRVSLETHRGQRPVVLVLGSFGCNVFSGQVDEVVRLHALYRDRAAFLLVGITDAGHPLSEMEVTGATRQLLLDNDKETRAAYLRRGLELYQISFPCLLDEYGEVERAYDAFPQRLLIVATDGNIVYDAGWGAQGGPSEWDFEQIDAVLAELVR